MDFGYLEDGTKVRVSKKSGMIIPFPPRDTYADRHRDKPDGPFDTPPDRVLEVTYEGEDFLSIREEFRQAIAEKEKIEEMLVFKD